MSSNLGANIKFFRKNKGFTQEELAGMLGVTPQAVSRWESEAGLPDVSMIVPIAQALNITTDALLGYHVQSQDDRITEQGFAKLKEFEDVEHPGQSALAVCEFFQEGAYCAASTIFIISSLLTHSPLNFLMLLRVSMHSLISIISSNSIQC